MAFDQLIVFDLLKIILKNKSYLLYFFNIFEFYSFKN